MSGPPPQQYQQGPPPQQYQQGPPPQQQQFQQSPPPQQAPHMTYTTTTTTNFGHEPQEVTCPHCQFRGLSHCEKKIAGEVVCLIVLCIIFIWSLIGLILLCILCANMNNFEIDHYCRNCKANLGKRVRVVKTTRI